MGKLRVFESISIDGYFADGRGDMSWAHAASASDPEFQDWVSSNASGGSPGALLFGRVTYEMMASFWPTPAAAAQMPIVAKHMNETRKIVVSKSLKPTWQNTSRLEGDLTTGVKNLKQELPSITVLGSGNVVAQLGEAGLVDEYQLVIVPVALGAGRTVFTKRSALELVSQRAFACGNVVVTYAT